MTCFIFFKFIFQLNENLALIPLHHMTNRFPCFINWLRLKVETNLRKKLWNLLWLVIWPLSTRLIQNFRVSLPNRQGTSSFLVEHRVVMREVVSSIPARPTLTQHSGEFDRNFSKMSNAPGFARGGGWAYLELTGTLGSLSTQRFWATDGNRKWTFRTLEQGYFSDFQSNRLC